MRELHALLSSELYDSDYMMSVKEVVIAFFW
jgi:hypothetical protein